jgi:hypothetical protein
MFSLAASSASASNPPTSMASRPAGCSIAPSLANGCQSRSVTDHDPLFRIHRWLANLRVLAIEEVESVPYAPASHPFIERLIGTVRREYLDHCSSGTRST